jgi:hypothetical protein
MDERWFYKTWDMALLHLTRYHDCGSFLITACPRSPSKGNRWMDGRWFYKSWDTALRVRDGKSEYLPTKLEAKRLFLSSEVDNSQYESLNSLDTING